jgi:hypothetical protein
VPFIDRKLTAVYTVGNLANEATWGFAFPNENETEKSVWHAASERWADKRIGLFLSRRMEDLSTNPDPKKSLNWKDSEIMIGYVSFLS